MTDPNETQQRVIDTESGITVVDAGAGTGKTFTITRRYAALIEQEDLDPDDVLLITFTNNAASEIRDRVVANCEYSMAALRDAPINTFHGFCHEFLLEYGGHAPSVLGIDDRLTQSTRLLENEVVETQRFEAFFQGFVDDHPEHHDTVAAVRDPASLLGVLKQLAAKGVFPTTDGWFRNGEAVLDGDFEAFKKEFDAANRPNEGANGPTQSDLRQRLGGFDRDRIYRSDAPSESELRGYPQVDEQWAERAFDEDRSALKSFVHDLYIEYIRFALGRNYLNFSFLQLFAYVLLCEDHDLRAAVSFDQVMVDEFQDTSEIQFKLVLLLAGADNICVVGDWKQSIYSFQYASVDNIRRFEDRIQSFKTDLNSNHERISYPVTDVRRISLRRNYRSTQSILDRAEGSLALPAIKSETVDAEEIVSLEAATDRDRSRIEAFRSDDETGAVLQRVREVVDNEAYAIEGDDGDLVAPSYEDIAVLTRKRKFGRELQRRAAEVGVPMAYDGGVRLFETDHAIVLLAWLRLLRSAHSRRGWAVVLEAAGYSHDEIAHVLDTEAYPEAMVAFRERLRGLSTVGGTARAVFDKYGFDDAYADRLTAVLQSTFESTTTTRGDLVRFIEDSLEAGATHEVTDTPGGDAVTVQTIHAAKGLQYPIVILADITDHSFPASGGDRQVIRYADPIGLRQTAVVDDEHGRPHSYDNWRYRVLSAANGTGYDEERRLLYVATTRAESHLLFSAGENPSPFFTGLSLEPTEVDPVLDSRSRPPTEQSRLQVEPPMAEGPIAHSPHSLMDDSVFETGEGTREVAVDSDSRGGSDDDHSGLEFGNCVHDFAERYADGEAVDPRNDHERRVADLLDSLDGELCPEENAYLPLAVGDRRVTVSGIVDLLHLTADRVDIVDYKTDSSRHAESEYRKQLSVYYHVVRQLYPDREIRTRIFYTATGEPVDVDPLSMADLVALVERVEAEEAD